MGKNAYITLLGRSSWSLLNTYYAVLNQEKFSPDIIHIFVENLYKDKLEKVLTGLQILNESFDIHLTIEKTVVSNDEIIPVKSTLIKCLKDLKNKGYTIALDITPGRKALVAAALMSTRKLGINHVFYLAVDSIEDIPLLMKPGAIIHLHDYLHENVTEVD
jgi:hypothetical protein